ncbi:PKD domain-containing protein, partial [Cytophaga aurantiaca]|uniref:PKD domain-containing protein n=1 Tax=Cytophaga aurantiaca TaxID=29530 RepID=UPI00316ADEAE
MNTFYNHPIEKSIKGIALLILFLLTNTLTYSQTYNWSNVAIGGGGFVSGIITSKTEQNVMFARTDVGGAYRWDATNSKWIPLLDWNSESETGFQGVESMAMDPQASKNVYMLVGTDYFNSGKTAILRSTDYGATFAMTDVTSQFKAHGNGMGRQNGEKLVVDPNKGSILFCGSRRNGLFKSTNSGASWSGVTTGVTSTANDNGISFVLIDPKSATTGNASQTIFFGVSQTSNNFYKSTNGGTSFSAVTGGPALMPQRAALASDGNMYITYADHEGPWNITTGQVWKYNTTSGAWTDVTPVAGYGYGGISVDPNNPQRLIASTTNKYLPQYTGVYGDRFYLSTNGGSTWKDLVGSGITLDPNGCTWIGSNSIHWAGCIEFNPFNTAQAYVISGNGLFICENVNATSTTWKFLSKGIEETVPLDIVSIPGGPLVSVIGDYDGFVHTDITQYAPIHTPRMGTTTGLAVAALSTSKMVRVGGDATNGGKMYYTANQGTSWTQTSSINGYKGKLALSANGNTILHCPEGSSTIYRSTNNGTAWTTSNGVSIADAVPVADQVNSNKIYAYNSTSGVMMVSTDGGANFSSSGSPGTGGSKIIRTVPGIEGDIWVPLYYGGLTHSTNSGASFTKLTNVTRCDAVGFGKAAPTASYVTIYIWGTVGGVTGVFASIDQGANWTRVNDDAHEYGGPGNGQFVIGDMNVFGRVYMSTVGRGIAYGETTTGTCTATITTPSTSFCTGGSTALTASTGVSYQWIKDLSPIANATNATYTATAAGSYTVSVTNASACTAVASATTITVNALPTATITAPATSFCTGGSVVLSANTGTGLTYQWSNAAGTIASATNVTYTATAAGAYTVKVTNTNNCSATSTATTITVNALPTATITAPATSFCTGGSVVLSANTGTGLTYQWSNAAGTIASATNITYTATAAGAYTVKVTNTNNCSATSTATTITVNALPTATITAPATSFCTGSSVILSANTGTGLTYQWSNAAGTIASATNVTYTANAAGAYTVKVTNTNNCSATSTATTITVNTLPTATITAPATSFCTGGSVVLSANTGTGLTYQWSNAAGTIAAATNATYTATAAGAYTVKVTNTNNCSSTSTATTITVNALPTATITAPATSFCTGGSVILSANTGTGLTYQWSNAAGTIASATNVTYTATAAGTYTVTVNNGTCSATSTGTTITVNALPTATITAPATSFCTGGSVILSANTGTGLTYQWLNAAGTIAGATNTTYTATAAGTYTVKVTNSTNCSATSSSVTITVTASQTATITSPSNSFCTGGSVLLSANTGTGLTYQWSNAAGTISGATNATYTATAANTYTVSVSNGSCTGTSTGKTITVNALPTSSITASATSFCTGGSATLSANTGTGLTYQWSNAAGTIASATNATYTATAAGAYTVTVNNGSCSATSTPTTITVNALPTATINAPATSFCTGGSVILSANTGTGLTYQWSNATGTIASATNATYTATAAGTYTVKVTNNNSCSATSTGTTITVTASITWYQDLDGDGKGDPSVTTSSCTQPTGYVSVAGDACPNDPAKIAAGNCGCGKSETSCLDCAGVPNGTAYLDNCSVCVGGT